jgi:tetratricopeptide (TPR) repeat protein
MIFPANGFSKNGDLSAMIKKAEHLIEQEAFQPGIAVLETILLKEPDNAQVLSQLLFAYEQYSSQLIEKGRFTQANTYLEKMDETINKIGTVPLPQFTSAELKIQSRVKRERAEARTFFHDSTTGKGSDVIELHAGRAHYNQAVEHFTRNEFEMAKELLLESLKYDQQNPYAFQLLGEIANLSQDLDTAEEYYKKAYAIDPDPVLKERLEKIFQEKSIDKDLQSYSDEHFIIRYRRGEKFEGSNVRAMLRDAYRYISQDFGFYPKHKVPVLLYDRSEFEELYSDVPHWLAAVFDGKIRLPVYESIRTEGELERFIYHELAHSFVLSLSKMKCPVWLNEGLAQRYEHYSRPLDLSGLRNAVRTNKLLPLDQLMFQEFTEVPSHDLATLYYLQSYSLADELVIQHGVYKVKQLLIEIGDEKPFLEAFQEIYGRPFEDFADKWRTAVKKKYG